MTSAEYEANLPALDKYVTIAPDHPLGVLGFYALGLNEEAGEFAGKVKKAFRDGTYDPFAMANELGDNLWYLTRAANNLGFTLEQIMQMNVDKLASRHASGKMHGSGDNR
jgi:NTP pyrophosphatase (non-canonical NTP hydrolase)